MAKVGIICPNCEFKLAAWKKYCPICGQELELPAGQAAEDNAQADLEAEPAAGGQEAGQKIERLRRDIQAAREKYDYIRVQKLLDGGGEDLPERAMLGEWIEIERMRADELNAAQKQNDRMQMIRLLRGTPDDYPQRNELLRKMVDGIHQQIQAELKQSPKEATYQEALRKSGEVINLVQDAQMTARLETLRQEIDQKINLLAQARLAYVEVEQAIQRGDTSRAIVLLEGLAKRYPERRDLKARIEELRRQAATQEVAQPAERQAAEQAPAERPVIVEETAEGIAADQAAKSAVTSAPVLGKALPETRRLFWTIGALVAVVGLVTIVIILAGWLQRGGKPSPTVTASLEPTFTLAMVFTETNPPTVTLAPTSTLAASDTPAPPVATDTPTIEMTAVPTWTAIQPDTATIAPTLTQASTSTPAPVIITPPFPTYTSTVAVKPTKPPAKLPTKPPTKVPTAFVPPTKTKTPVVPKP